MPIDLTAFEPRLVSTRFLEVERQGEAWCARLRQTQLDEPAVQELGDELLALVDRHGCRKLVLVLGPDEVVCLYSLLLSKLVTLQKHLHAVGGALRLAQVGPATRAIFDVCRLSTRFAFCSSEAEALADLTRAT